MAKSLEIDESDTKETKQIDHRFSYLSRSVTSVPGFLSRMSLDFDKISVNCRLADLA